MRFTCKILIEQRKNFKHFWNIAQLQFTIYILAGDQVKERKTVVTWCFTPSQPVRLYQGEKERKTTIIK